MRVTPVPVPVLILFCCSKAMLFQMAHRARIVCVGVLWWVLGMVGLCAGLSFIWVTAVRFGIVQARSSQGWGGYYGLWANVIGFSCLVALTLGVIGISIAVITLSRRGRLPGARERRQQRGFAVGK
jgi:hypothetical protein